MARLGEGRDKMSDHSITKHIESDWLAGGRRYGADVYVPKDSLSPAQSGGARRADFDQGRSGKTVISE
jgi:hypothetical protein